jgi:hypothetical protein
VEVDSAATSCWPRLSDSSGIDKGTKIASAASPASNGCLAMSAAHLAHRPVLICASVPGARTRSELIRGPTMPSKAGSNVSAASTDTTTATAAMNPSVVTSGIPATASETSAIVTVPPAKKTAPPDVAVARATDSGKSSPSESPLKCRVTMNSA